MRYLITEWWESITLFGLPPFYLFTSFLIMRTNPSFAGSKTLALLIVLEGACALIKLAFPKDRPSPSRKDSLLKRYSAGSFPSIHSARIAAFSTILFITFASDFFLRLVFCALVILVGYSRIYLRKHYLVDVLAGWIIGFGFGLLWMLI